MSTMSKQIGLAVATGSILVLGCPFTETNTQHCNYNDGDAYCAAQYPDGSRPYCESGEDACVSPDTLYGCVPERPADACYSPCGGRSTIGDNGECVAVEDSSSGSSSGGTETDGSSESSTTGPLPCMGNEDCTDGAAPFCEPVSGECVRCDAFGAEADAACAGLDPLAPLCVNGACVACTAEAPGACTGLTPVCDDATNTCVPCNTHDQCGEAACNLFTGACLPADAVVHAGAGQMYTTLGAAVSSFDMMTEGTIIVHQAMPNYDESVTVDGGRVLAFLAADDVAMPPRWLQGGGGSPQLTVADATVLMDGLQLSGNADNLGLVVNGGRAWVDRSRIVQNSGGGVLAQNAAELTLRNCFVGSLGDVIGVDVVDASASVLYSTITASTFGTTPALGCTTPVAVDVRDSIVVSQGGTSPDELSCPAATIVGSATEADVGAFAAGWFVNFNGADYHLTPMGTTAFADIAQWTTSDPPTDIDGDPRPTVDGTPDYAGADVP